MLKNYLNKVLSLFIILGFVFIPFTFYGPDYQYRLTRFLFLTPVAFIQDHFFAHAIKHIDFSSDTIGLNILLWLLAVIAFLVIFLLDLFKVDSSKIIPFGRSLSAYYTAAILLTYGLDKIFKRQFYLPEPNILYTPFGNLTRDTLFWSTMGVSHSYSLLTGMVEVVTALLLLIWRTRVLGFCVAIGVFINILFINIGFDISVKTFTAFLLLVSVYNLYPYIKNMYVFFVRHQQVQLDITSKQITRAGKWGRALLSIGLVGYILFPYISSGSFNDDNAPRPFLHGAYSVERFITGNDTLNNCDFPYKRFFIHRNNYIIFQQRDDTMTDYFFEMDPIKKQLELQDYKKNKIIIVYEYDAGTGALRLDFGNREKCVIESVPLNWKTLPALQGKIHYTIDEIK